MIKNRYLQDFLDEFYGGDPSKVSRLEITSDAYPLSEEAGVNLITEGHTFWQLEDLSKENFSGLKELCIIDEPIIHGFVETGDLNFVLIAECPHIHMKIRGVTYDVQSTREKAWIYEYKEGKVTITRE